MKILFLTVGGTIDKDYFDKLSTYQVGDPKVRDILTDAKVAFRYDIRSLLKKDSLDMTDQDRKIVFEAVKNAPEHHVVITHGTDTMVETAVRLKQLKEKTVVLTGALEPAHFRSSDAFFNLGCAVAAVQILPPGIHIAINGKIFDPENIEKDRSLMQFVEKKQKNNAKE